MRWIIAATFAFLAFCVPTAAQAWGQGGHYTVCEIAYLNLTPTTKAEVDRLVALNGAFRTFTETCTFPDNPPSRSPEHFANYPRSTRRVAGPGCPGGRPCVIEALIGDLRILRSGADDSTKGTTLLFIGHWFGDLHQPLHISFADDRGGNQIDVSGSCRYSLHSTWDTCVVEERILPAGTDRLARVRTAAAALSGAVTAAQRAAWQAGEPVQWADESYQIAIAPQTGYCVQKPDSCWYSASAQTWVSGAAKRNQPIDAAYLAAAAPIVAERLQRAGIRLAHALNATFDPAYRGADPAVPAPVTPLPPQPAAVPEVGLPAAGTYVVHAIDVGTGLAIFIEGADFTLLYDAGSNDDDARDERNRVVAYLRAVRPNLRRIDHLILSHPHKDHSELMPDVVEAYEIGNLWDSGALNPICSYRQLLVNVAAEPGAVYHHATGKIGPHTAVFNKQNCYGKALDAATVSIARSVQITPEPVPLGAGASMVVLHADGSKQPSFNENSVVVRVDLGARRILLPGDAEAGGRKDPSTPPAPSSIEGELLASRAAALRSDILVAGHHGSKTSSRTAFLDAVGAAHYVVSAGPKKYASVTLPDREVVEEMDRRGTVWRTDVNDATCPKEPAKIGPDADGDPGGCDNLRFVIARDGTIDVTYLRRAD